MPSKIQFIAEWSTRSVAFLDVNVIIYRRGTLNNGPVYKTIDNIVP